MTAPKSASEVRLAEPDDISLIVRLMLSAGAGLYEHLLAELIAGLGPGDLLALAIAEDTSAYFYANALIAELDAHRVGLALSFAAEDLALPQAVLGIVPAERLEPMNALIKTAEPGSVYLNSLAVDPTAGRRGVGRLLLETTAALAQARGAERLSLHVWTDNAPAMRLYESLGFEVRALIDMAPSPHFTHRGPVAAVAADIASMLGRFARA